jgi:hypothetical protein
LHVAKCFEMSIMNCCHSHVILSMLHSFLCTHEIYLCIHAIGVPEGVILLEFEGVLPEEDQEQPRVPEEPVGEGVPEEELPECPDHRPSSSLKGKPRCMLTHLLYTHTLSTFNCLLH